MNVDDLEAVLLFFYDNRAQYHYFNDIKQNFQERGFTDLELQAIIQKLVKDAYIIEEEQMNVTKNLTDGSIKEEYKKWGWFISYDGMFIIDTLPRAFSRKPYTYLNKCERKKKRAAFIENAPKKYWWVYNPIAYLIPLTIGFFLGKEKFDSPKIKSEDNVTKSVIANKDTSRSAPEKVFKR